MKTLLAVRHAKSSWGEPDLPDHDRPLNKRGDADAPLMGEALKKRGVKPDCMLSSTANRALTTARILAEKLGFPKDDIIESKKWYLASAGIWLVAVQQIDESAETAMIFGHNPGMHEFAQRILKKRSPELDEFPTLAVAHLQFDVDHWGEVDWGEADLVQFLYPKGL